MKGNSVGRGTERHRGHLALAAPSFRRARADAGGAALAGDQHPAGTTPAAWRLR